jgi:ribosomal protein S12 methylthiotransferase accessory factor YcaO
MRYTIRLARTARTVGYVEFDPEEGVGLSDAFEYLDRCPMDTYMHRFALSEMAHVEPSRARKMAAGEAAKANPAMAAVIAEAAEVYPKFAKLAGRAGDPGELAAYSPLVELRAAKTGASGVHGKWMKLFRKNVERHKLMPGLEEADLPEPELTGRPKTGSGPAAAEVRDRIGPEPEPAPVEDPEDVAKRAAVALQRIGLRAEGEMRHTASLAPVGLLREWLLETSVKNACLDYEINGKQTAYGRGLDLASARASYFMEIVERRSAWAKVADMRCLGHIADRRLVKASLSELTDAGKNALDPNEMLPEIPYGDQSLHWLEAEKISAHGNAPILVPAQMVYLFLNLDEQELYSGYGSTGLASGNTASEARLSALMEVIERDAEAVTPYHPSRCFRLEADDVKVAEALADYKEKGIEVAFQDLTTEFGIPCYKAFAIGPSGRVAKGAGAGLSGARAAISALTEVPYAYPQGPESKPVPENLPIMKLEDLPELTSGLAERDLTIAERTLTEHGYEPVYVDLTLEAVNIPVVRALVPGLEHAADFDENAPVPRRLFENYKRLYADGLK